jgi:hypothetical protein
MKKGWAHWFILFTFVGLYVIVSLISTIHVVEFFSISNPKWLAISLAIAFELGAAASLSSLVVLKKMNKTLVWSLFIVLTAMQAMGNTYYSYTHLQNFDSWIELFGLVDEDIIYQKRILSILSGAILPFVALGFIKSLVDYIKPEDEEREEKKTEELKEKEESEAIELETEELNQEKDSSESDADEKTQEENPTPKVEDQIEDLPVKKIEDPVLRYKMGLAKNKK